MNRHLISAADLSRDDAILILDTAAELASVAGRPIRKLPTLRGLTVVNCFYEDSTRTRTSFEAAAKRLSADVINFSAKGSSVAKGESLKDTALTLEAMGTDAVIIRHSASGAAHTLARWVTGSVVNAGDGTHEHPTQALLDAFTMRQRLVGDGERGRGMGLDGLRVTIVGDVLHSRVARSNVLLLSTLGAEVTLVAPPTLMPYAVESWSCKVSYDLDAELRKADVVMMLRVQQERMSAAYFPSIREYRRRYGLGTGRMALLPEHAIVSDEANTSGIWLAGATAGAPPHDWLSLTGGAIGQGLPVATGAAVACPGRPVLALEADGSAMYTISALWTHARENLDITTVIFSNRAYAILAMELERTGAPVTGTTARDLLDLSRPDLDFTALAAGMGGMLLVRPRLQTQGGSTA